MKKLLKRRSGEGYIDVCVLVVCAMLVLSLVVRVLPVYITKQQRETLLKWTLYGVLTLLCLVIQDTFLSGIWVFGASPGLVPMVILLIGMMQSTEAGATFALCAALFYYHAGSAPGAFAVAALPLLEFALSAFRQSYLRKSIGATVFSAASALILYEFLVFFAIHDGWLRKRNLVFFYSFLFGQDEFHAVMC